MDWGRTEQARVWQTRSSILPIYSMSQHQQISLNQLEDVCRQGKEMGGAVL
jgi:hypothetical protein